MSDKELTITTTLAKRDGFFSRHIPGRTKADVWIEYRIHAPHGTNLVIGHGPGSVHVTDIDANIEANGSRGDILFMLREPESYSIDAKTQFGSVVTDFGANVHRTSFLIGREFATNKAPGSHKIYARMGYGGITVKAIPKEAYGPSAQK